MIITLRGKLLMKILIRRYPVGQFYEFMVRTVHFYSMGQFPYIDIFNLFLSCLSNLQS